VFRAKSSQNAKIREHKNRNGCDGETPLEFIGKKDTISHSKREAKGDYI